MLTSLMISTIDGELAWRESELALAKIQLHRSIGDPKAFGFAYRCFAAITYAHYEGFVKKILSQALTDIISSGIPQVLCNSTLQKSLFGPLVRKKITELSNDELVEKVFLNASALNEVPFPSPDDIFNISNMNYANFVWCISCIGMNHSQFDTYKGTVNHITVLRHECAHGELLNFDSTKTEREVAAAIFAYQATIITLLHDVSVEIVDHFTAQKFKSP